MSIPRVAALLALSVCRLTAQCPHEWSNEFSGSSAPTIFSMVTLPGSVPPRLALAGNFVRVGGADSAITTWDGRGFGGLAPLPYSGLQSAQDAVIFDDGSGPALHLCVGGVAGAPPHGSVVKWTGSGWTQVGPSLCGYPYVLHVFDDGTGPALYVGGLNFESSTLCSPPPVIPGGVLKLVAGQWVPAATSAPGADAGVRDLITFDDGAGPALWSSVSSTSSASRVMKLVGATWVSMAQGLSAAPHDLEIFDDGTGPALYAGTSSSNALARWNGTSWVGMGGAGGNVQTLEVYDDGSGPTLYVGGSFTISPSAQVHFVGRWTAAGWSLLPTSVDAHVWEMAVHDDGAGPALFVAGNFGTAGGLASPGLARWNGQAWSALHGQGSSDGSAVINAMLRHDDGNGPALFATGQPLKLGQVTVNGIGRYDGQTWSPLGSGLSGLSNSQGHALLTHDDGSGRALYVGGRFSTAGSGPAQGIAKWDGTSWSPVGGGVSFGSSPSIGEVFALATFDDGAGEALYAAGIFWYAGATPANSIARWDGVSWTPLGAGVNGAIYSLAVCDFGAGPRLVAGGFFASAGGAPAANIAQWDGVAWTPLGAGFNANVLALHVMDEGSGTALYAGGGFTQAGGAPAEFIARWDGVSWSALGAGLGVAPGFPSSANVSGLTSYDDGSGRAMYAFGRFSLAGGQLAYGAARWKNGTWSTMGSGFSSCEFASTVQGVKAAQAIPDGPLAGVYAGGQIKCAGGVGSISIARWRPVTGAPACAELGPEAAGRVGIGAGGPFDVLFVQGSSGAASGRRVNVPLLAPVGISVAQPATTPYAAAFSIFGRIGAPGPSEVTALPLGLGSTCFAPCPLDPANPLLFTLADSLGLAGPCPPLAGATTAPWALAGPGIGFPVQIALQGLISDASAPFGLSITNAVLLAVGP
jgi:trimeric autotransporter adhesin